MRQKISVRYLTLSALFLALGIVLPFLTGQIPSIGSMLLPMHIPVLLCGFVCATAVAMAFEMAVYGAVTGLLYDRLSKNTASIYKSLIGAMLAGRIVWGVVSMGLFSMVGKTFSWQIFVGGALLNAIPGIILQIVLIPMIVLALKRAKVME